MSNQNNAVDLLLEFIFKNDTKIPFIKPRYPVQGILIYYGISIKNIGKTDFPGGNLSDLKIKHPDYDIVIESYDSKPVPPLLPGEKIDIWVINTIINIPGPVWVSCSIKANNNEITINPYQCSRGEDNGIPLKSKNSWSHSEYVQPRLEFLQSLTNYLILFLTIIVVIDIIVGFDNIFSFIAQISSSLWNYLASKICV